MEANIKGWAPKKKVLALKAGLERAGFRILNLYFFGRSGAFSLLLEIEESDSPALRAVMDFLARDWLLPQGYISQSLLEDGRDLSRFTLEEEILIDVEMREARRLGGARCVI